MNLKLSASAWMSRWLSFGTSPRSAAKSSKSVRGGKSIRAAASGIVSVEIALLAVGLLGGMHMLFFTGRLSEARGRAQDIVSEAARVASHAQDGTEAQKRVADFLKGGKAKNSKASSKASSTAEACRKPQATVDTSAFRRGGSVSVKVRCTISLADLSLVRIPGSLTLEASAAEVIDVLRSGS